MSLIEFIRLGTATVSRLASAKVECDSGWVKSGKTLVAEGHGVINEVLCQFEMKNHPQSALNLHVNPPN